MESKPKDLWFRYEEIYDNDDDDSSDSTTLTRFEKLAAKMENVTPDGGVKKQVISQGIGDVVPSDAFVVCMFHSSLPFQ